MVPVRFFRAAIFRGKPRLLRPENASIGAQANYRNTMEFAVRAAAGCATAACSAILWRGSQIAAGPRGGPAWQGGRAASGWWQHGKRRIWLGSGRLFWPFAYHDIYDYTIWGDGIIGLLWDYGYPDIYAGIFAPYGYEDLARYLAQRPFGAAGMAGPAPLGGKMCG